MARYFASSVVNEFSSEFSFEFGSGTAGLIHKLSCAAPVVVPPFIMGCRFLDDVLGSPHVLMSLQDVGTGSSFTLRVGGSGSVVVEGVNPAFGNFSFETAAVVSANTWSSALWIEAANNVRSLYVNGGNKVTNNLDFASQITGIDTLAFGGFPDPASRGVSWELVGALANCFVVPIATTAALADRQAALFHAGWAPEKLFAGVPVYHWPLMGRFGYERDVTGRFPLTISGTSFAKDPPVERRKRIRPEIEVVILGAPAGAGFIDFGQGVPFVGDYGGSLSFGRGF